MARWKRRALDGLRLDASIDHAFAPDVALAEGDTISGPGWTLEALFTPGHMSNHLCFALKEEHALFSGDHVMAWATSVIAPPDGGMGQYFASLRKLLDREDQVYHPGHGPSKRDPLPLVRGYLAHRRMREEAIRARVEQGARTVPEIVATIYADVDPRLHGAAALSTTAHLASSRGTGQAPQVPAASTRRSDSMARKTPDQLRSARWFAPDDLRGFGHRSRLMQMGYAKEDWAGKPSIAIINTWSGINPCHAHFRERAEDVKRGVLQAGGFPDRASRHVARGDLRQAHHHALPQHAGDGGGRADPLPPG